MEKRIEKFTASNALLDIGLSMGALCTGLAVGMMIGDGLANAEERVTAVQEHNSQIEQSLERDFPGMGRLILNDETNAFEFHVPATSEATTDQTCTGSYEVNAQNWANVASEIACTTVVKLGD